MDMKRFFLYAIAIAALALAGCGGNGGGGTTPPEMPPVAETCPDGHTGTPPNCVAPPPPPTNDSFPGTDMEAAMAIFLPTRAGDAGDLNDARRPQTPVTVAAKGDYGETTIDGDVLNKDDDNIKDAEEFMRDGDAVRAVLDDFPNVMVQSRTVEDETDTVTIYSDVKSRGDMKYLQYFHTDNDGTGPQNRPAVVTSMNETETDDGYGILTLEAAITTADSGLFVSAAFPSAENQTYTYTNDDPATTDDEETRGGRTLEGTFAGVSGKFICAGTGGAACTAGTDSKGRLLALAGGWTFVPDDRGGYVRNVIPDLDFLSFGYWLHTDEDGDYSVNAFLPAPRRSRGMTIHSRPVILTPSSATQLIPVKRPAST